MDEATRILRQYFYPYYCPIPIRALFIYENTWNISFDIDSGRIRMLNNQKENRYISLFVMILFRAVYRVLFLYMFLSARKGCYSTALEISKCLYSQDPQLDHQGAMLLMGILRLSLITNRLLCYLCKQDFLYCRALSEYSCYLLGYWTLSKDLFV